MADKTTESFIRCSTLVLSGLGHNELACSSTVLTLCGSPLLWTRVGEAKGERTIIQNVRAARLHTVVIAWQQQSIGTMRG